MMDNKVLDEAVEVGVNAAMIEVGPFELLSEEAQSSIVRAALLASLPVLLGEPVAWIDWAPNDSVYLRTLGKVRALEDLPDGTKLYAPSLGEGDGR